MDDLTMPEPEETPSLEVAAEALENAVEVFVRALTAAEDTGITGQVVTTEFIVAYAYRGWNESGEDIFGVGAHPSSGATPQGAVGLLHSALWDAQAEHQGYRE